MELSKCPKGHDVEVVGKVPTGAVVFCAEPECWQGPVRGTPEEAAAEWNEVMGAVDDARKFREIVQHVVNHEVHSLNVDRTFRLCPRDDPEGNNMRRERNWDAILDMAEKAMKERK